MIWTSIFDKTIIEWYQAQRGSIQIQKIHLIFIPRFKKPQKQLQVKPNMV